jgi:hypothetical protein
MPAHLLPSLLLLSACGQQVAPAGNDIAAAPEAKPAAAAPKAFAVDEKNDLIDFHFGWSPEAAAVPELVDRFGKEMRTARTELVAGAEEDKAFRDDKGFDFNGFMSTTDYRTAGQSAVLLSLSIESGTYTGGAHGNYGVGSLLWDRAAAREIKPANLFAEPANMDRLLTQRWCDALNKAREEKRGEPVGGEGMFDDCPSLGDIAIIPKDNDGNGKFDRLLLVASPYVAGPWVEGAYEVELGVTPDVLAALKNGYRTGFEAGQTQ